MSETIPPPETPQPPTREQVIQVFKKFVDRGVTHPDDLSPDDPEVAEANRLLVAWHEQETHRAQQNPAPDAILESSLDQSLLLVDAGFSDPTYLDEIANDWLSNELESAEEQNLPEVATKIRAKIDEINTRLTS